MAITQRMLKALGVDDEDKREQILDEYQAGMAEARQERDRYKEEVAKLREDLKEARESADDGWEEKFNEERRAFEDFKARVEAERAEAEKARAYREQVLAKAGIDPKRVDTLMRVVDLSGVELEDGKVKDAEALVRSAAEEWSDFVVQRRTEGADVQDPPGGPGDGKQASDIAKRVIRERQERLYGNKATDEGGSE